MPRVILSGPSTTTTMTDFSKIFPFVRYTFLLSVLSFREKRTRGLGFVHEETISSNRLGYEGPEDNSGIADY